MQHPAIEEIQKAVEGAADRIYLFRERDYLQVIEEPLGRLRSTSLENKLQFVLAALDAMRESGDMGMQLALKAACGAFLRRSEKLPVDTAAAIRMVESMSQRRVLFPYKGVLTLIDGSVAMTPALSAALLAMKPHIDEWLGGTEMRDLHERIDRLAAKTEGAAEPEVAAVTLEPAGDWSRAVFQEIAGEPDAWRALFAHAREMASSTASQKWQKEAVALIDAIGRAKVLEAAARWLALGPMPGGALRQVPEPEADYQKGFVWALGAVGDARIAPAIGDFALACFRKIPMIGAVSHRTGNACVHALAAMPGLDAVSQLSRLAAKVKYDVARRLIEKALVEAAVRNGVSREDIEAMSVPVFGLDPETGVRVEAFEPDIEARLAIDAESGGAALTWIREGKPLKSMPAAVQSEELAVELKKTAKELDAALSTQRIRLERLLLLPEESFCAFDRWREWYVEHPVVGFFARRLIWELEFADGSVRTVLPLAGAGLVDWAGQVVDCGAAARVRLWHPIRGSGGAGGDPIQTVLSWRCFLEDRGIRQPFKQAHREVYLLTGAERETATYSNRFASHIVRQHLFAALCRERGWDFRLMGPWDSHNTPTLALPQYQLTAEFGVDFPRNPEEVSGHAIYLAIRTGQVRFVRNGAAVRVEEVPAAVFSEVMRDCDLFTGVASIGADPAWEQQHENERTYWQEFAFGELSAAAENRKSILSSLLPKLAIRDRCRIDGRFLVVRGNLHEYRIHLGSANVIREPGSQYLCIVQGAGDRAARVALPFEGDRILSLILSKALLLAEDSKIRDESIRRQLV